MKTALLVLLCIVGAFAEYEIEEGVYVLTDDNFGQAMNEFDYALVEFYAPWCGHCKTLAPQYAAAAQKLATTNPEIKLAKVDATVHDGLAKKFEIRGFPTLKFFIKGNSQPIAYEAGRTADEIVNWLRKKTGPASIEAKSAEEAEKLIGDNDVIGFFFGSSGSESLTTFLATAATFDDLTFAHTTDESLRQKYDVQGEALVLFKKFDEGKNVFTGPFQHNEIRDFLNKNRFPTVVPFDQKAAQRIFGEGHDSIFLVRADDAQGASAEQALVAASQDIKGKLTISVARIEDNLGGRLADYIGVSRDNLPAIRIVRPNQNMQKFYFENDFTADNIKAFVDDFLAGKLTASFKSEPIPADPYDDNVRIVVGKNWKEIVEDPNTDVLIEYYAPWCGHCKALAPVFSSLGKKLRNVSGLVIAKMDSTANEVDGLNIQGFPTIKFYPKGKKNSPVDYSGERTEDGFIDYLKRHSSANFEGASHPVQDEL
jgi:protein disulfide-isomerase A1